MTRAFAPTALLLGNFATGVTVIGPTAMLSQLALGLNVGIQEAGLLITFGAIVLCIASPVTAWLTSQIDRRALLTFTALAMAAGNFISAFVADYSAVMAARLIVLAAAALFTPQAAGAAAMLAPPEQRGSSISYVYLGWSLAIAFGLPIIAHLAGTFGWRGAFGFIGGVAFVSAALLAWRLPGGLKGAPVDLKTWGGLMRSPVILMLLVITTLQMSGQFTILTYVAPLLSTLTGAESGSIAIAFFVYGVAGFVGNVVASRIVDGFGAYKTSLLATSLLFFGIGTWLLGAGSFALMTAGILVWGLGFASSNSMQQVRLSIAAPAETSASVSLNTAVLYIGQSIGSGVGGFFFVREMYNAMMLFSLASLCLAITLIFFTRRRMALAVPLPADR